MRVDAALLAIAALLMAGSAALAQGYADLGRAAPGFAQPDPNTQITLPADHGPHPDFRIEWWYLTANLIDETGRDWGAQWTLFRSRLRPATPDDTGASGSWQSPQFWMGHAALTAAQSHAFAEVFARGGTGQAGARAAPFAAWIDDWSLSFDGATARGDGFSYDLGFSGPGATVLHGANGYSVKSEAGTASHYYSQPFITVTGWVETAEGRVNVTGQAWFDHEWSSQPLAGDQPGWDWSALTLEDGTKLMVAQVRQTADRYLFGTLISPDGTTRPLTGSGFDMQPKSKRTPPTVWQISVPDEGLDLTLRAINDDARTGGLFPYWEGPVTVSGSHKGVGYLEMTGQ